MKKVQRGHFGLESGTDPFPFPFQNLFKLNYAIRNIDNLAIVVCMSKNISWNIYIVQK